MSPEKSQQLINIFPELFSDLHPMEPFAMFGFECDDGWFDLLKDLISNIKEKYNDPAYEHEFNIADEKIVLKVDQIKEKYGTLRFYVNCCNGEIGRLIKQAEEISETTCEECGKEGSMREKGLWYSVRCDECWNAPKKSAWG
jgi:hypothetical protein